MFEWKAVLSSSSRRQAPVILTLLTAIVAVALACVSLPPPTRASRRSGPKPESVLAQIEEIDSQLSHAIEAYNLANVKLDKIEGELKTNARHLKIARQPEERPAPSRRAARRAVRPEVPTGALEVCSAPSRSTTSSTASTRSTVSPPRTRACSAR